MLEQTGSAPVLPGRFSFLGTASVCRSRANCGQIQPTRGMKRLSERLLGVGLYDLAHQFGPIHIDCFIDRTRLGPTVVFEDFDHQSRVVR
jgi:hypothetical protein